MPSIATLYLLSAASLAAAQTTVLNMFVPGVDGDNLQASVIAATSRPPSATYFVQCGPGSAECGLGPGVTVSMAPGTYAFELNQSPAFTMSIRCEAEHQTAICTSMGSGSEANDPGTVTETMTDFSSEDLFKAVTVTAGLEKVIAGSSNGVAAQPTQAASSSPGSSGKGAASAAASPSSGGAAPTSTTSAGGAAMPQITQHAVLAGVAALVGGAMVL